MIRFTKLLGAFALASALVVAPAISSATVFIDVGISVNLAPPLLPVYEQPPCPQPDLIWTPGYWGYDDADGYFWVPGAWVPAPEVGYLWTPGCWSYDDGDYAWNPGYWGPVVGYYGGVNYGYGYFGSGFYGGTWAGRHFRYNTAYARVDRGHVRYVYSNRTVLNHSRFASTRVSYNGGPHGTSARPSARERTYAGSRHLAATPLQRTHAQNAARDRTAFAKVNHGRPPRTLSQGRPSARQRALTQRQYVPSARVAAGRESAGHGRGARPQRVGHATHAPADHRATAYHSATTHHTATGYHAAVTHHAATADRPSAAHHASTAYSHHAAPAYHSATAYHAPRTYHPAAAYRAAPAYHAAPAYRAAPAYHPAPRAYHPQPAYHPAGASRGGGGGGGGRPMHAPPGGGQPHHEH